METVFTLGDRGWLKGHGEGSESEEERAQRRSSRVATHLGRVHFKLAHDLDGDFAGIALQVAGAVHIAEGAVTHLFEQLPALEAAVLRQLALGLLLLGDDARESLGVDLGLDLVGGRMDCIGGGGNGLILVTRARVGRLVALGLAAFGRVAVGGALLVRIDR